MTVASDHLPRFVKPGKARFDDVYDRPDPRGYWRTVGALEYRTPYVVRGLFRKAIAALRQVRSKPTIGVLDLCCGYGTNAAMVNYDIEDDGFYRRYGAAEMDALTSEQVIEGDRAFFAGRARPAGALFGGVDIADGALSYVRRVGLVHGGFNVDLETQDPDRDLRTFLNRVDLVIETGGLGYVGAASFRRVLSGAGCDRLPWLISVPMRLVEFEPVAELWREFGLTVEKIGGGIPHRRFRDDRERDYVLDELRGRGLDVLAGEEGGMMYADVYVGRPPQEANAPAVDALASAISIHAGQVGGRGPEG